MPFREERDHSIKNGNGAHSKGRKEPRPSSHKTTTSTTKSELARSQGARHQLAHQVHHVQLVDESVHNTLVLMKKSLQQRRKRSQQQQQLQKQQQPQSKGRHRIHIEEGVLIPPVPLPEEGIPVVSNKGGEDGEGVDYVSATENKRDQAADDNTQSDFGLLTLDNNGVVPGIKINGDNKVIIQGSNRQRQPHHKRSSPLSSAPPKPKKASSATTAIKNNLRHNKGHRRHQGQAKLLSAYESIIFSESQIPVFLRRQDDLLRQGSGAFLGRGKKSSRGKEESLNRVDSPATDRHDDNNNNDHDNDHSPETQLLLRANNINTLKNSKKMGVVVASSSQSSALDISGIANPGSKEDVHAKDKDKNERNIVEINSSSDPKITKHDGRSRAGGHRQRKDTNNNINNDGGCTEQDSDNAVVAQNLDSSFSSSSPSEQALLWELREEGEERRPFMRHQPNHQPPGIPELVDDHSRRLFSSSNLAHENYDFDASSSTWILLLGLIVSAIIIKKVYTMSRHHSKRPNSSHAYGISSDTSKVPLMKDFDSNATLHTP